MKHLYLKSILAYLFICFVLNPDGLCQDNFYLGKKSQEVGLKFRGGFGGQYDYTGNIGINYHYFLFDRVSLGASLNYYSQGNEYSNFYPGISGKWYILNKKFTPTVELGANFFFEHARDNESLKNASISDQLVAPNFKVGVSYLNIFNNRGSIELNVGYINQGFSPEIGISYRF